MSKQWNKIGYVAQSKAGNGIVVAVEIDKLKTNKTTGKAYGFVDLKDIQFVLNNPKTFASIVATEGD